MGLFPAWLHDGRRSLTSNLTKGASTPSTKLKRDDLIKKIKTRFSWSISPRLPSNSIRLDDAEYTFNSQSGNRGKWQDEPVKLEKLNNTSPTEQNNNQQSSEILEYDPRTTIKPLEGIRLFIVLFVLIFGLFLSTVETSITATALVRIGIYFDDSYTTNWVVLSYLLTYMGFSVIFARLSDAIGRKSAILLSWFLFGIFSLASGLATSLTQLIIFRSFQGIGGSGLFTMAMTVAPQVTPGKYWGALSGSLGAALACSSLTGPILGGIITQRIGWRWIYLYNAPLALIIVIPLLTAWPKSPSQTNQPRSLLLSQIDLPGAFLLLAASTLLVFALDQGGGYRLSWDSTTIVSSLTISALCWVGFVAWILYVNAGKVKLNIKPIFPLKSTLARPTGPAILLSFLAGLPFFIVMINLPIRFQLLNGNSPTVAGLHLMPLLSMSALGSGVGGLFSIKKNRTYYTLVVASFLICLGTGFLSTIPATRVISLHQYIYQAILGFGIGLSLSSITVMTGLASDFDTIASVNGAVNQARVLGGSIGLSVANIILNNKISSQLSQKLTPNELRNLQQSLSTITNLAPSKQMDVVYVFASSFNTQMRVCFYISIAGFFISQLTFQRNPPSVEAHKAKQQAMKNRETNQP